MQISHAKSPTKKVIPAVIAGLSVSVFLVVAILALGLNALFNTNVTATKNADPPSSQMTSDQATIQQLQATISQYQSRETQYQNELQQAADQINQINQQNLQYQQLIQALQNAGIIQITQDGRVFVGPGGGSRFGNNEP